MGLFEWLGFRTAEARDAPKITDSVRDSGQIFSFGTNGYESAAAWYDSTAELMTERMVYGCDIFHNQMAGTNMPAWHSIDYGQLPLFRYNRSLIGNRINWWLRDVSSAYTFSHVGSNGFCSNTNPHHEIGVRPAFAIRG